MRAQLLATALASSLGGCTTPCGQLRDRAEACGTGQSPYVKEQDSVCAELRAALGKKKFDSFSDCIAASGCDDEGAVTRCEEKHLEASSEDPCTRFQIWAVGCGLEPVGTEDDCQGVSGSFVGGTFGQWVGCVTEGGCPVPEDDRYDRCAETILPAEPTLLIEACVRIEEWTTRCAEEAPDWAMVEPVPLAQCLAQSRPYTAQSYYDYAICLEDVACDSVADRIACLIDNLRFIDDSRVEEQCEELIEFEAGCNSVIGGGNVEVCMRLFDMYTADSFGAYITCIQSFECGDPMAPVSCGYLLELQ